MRGPALRIGLMVAAAHLACAGAVADGHGIVSRLDLSEWVGEWSAGPEQSITISMPDLHGLQIEGFATYGLHDPDRAAIGAINIGEFSAWIESKSISANNEIAFMAGPEGAEPVTAAGEYDCTLSIRLDWNVKWIEVADNGMCGGHNVTFTGRYLRGTKTK